MQKWMSLYASKEGPTVSLMDPINIFENQDRMLEFTDENAPFLSNIEESALSTLTFDGKFMGHQCRQRVLEFSIIKRYVIKQ